MASHSLGLTLHQAARQKGVSFTQENEPVDRTVRVDGMTFHYLEWGQEGNPLVVMLHGGSQQAHSWDFVSLPLSEDFHIIAMDQRGHGDSDWATDGDYTIEAHQRDIDGFVEALGITGFHLIGHSMGGRNSYVWASRNPDKLRSLVIVDTGPVAQSRGRNRIQNFRELPDELDSFEEFADRVQEYTAALGSRPWEPSNTASGSGPTASGHGSTTSCSARPAAKARSGHRNSFGRQWQKSPAPPW